MMLKHGNLPTDRRECTVVKFGFAQFQLCLRAGSNPVIYLVQRRDQKWRLGQHLISVMV